MYKKKTILSQHELKKEYFKLSWAVLSHNDN